jgi:hypothetical protein
MCISLTFLRHDMDLIPHFIVVSFLFGTKYGCLCETHFKPSLILETHVFLLLQYSLCFTIKLFFGTLAKAWNTSILTILCIATPNSYMYIFYHENYYYNK